MVLGLIQILIFFALVIVVTKPLGLYMKRVFEGDRTLLSPVLRPVENLWYKLLGINAEEDQPWTKYAVGMLMFSGVSMLFTYAALRLQAFVPAILNPQKYGADQIPSHLAFNTSASFTTNTNWQSYSPEATLTYASNMIALAIHNWASAAVGMAVAISLVRGFARRKASGIGNFWVDVTRGTLYVLLPISVVFGTIMIAAGVPQNFDAPTVIKTLEGATQTIAMGPVASQEVIKMLGTNGGGFFNANSSHPFENPSNFTNLVQLFLIFAIPAGLTYTFGKMVGSVKQGWSVFAAMSILFLAGAVVSLSAEQAGTPQLAAAHISTASSDTQPGGNMEGKETRFGIGASTLFATVTTDASCGAVNSMHDSFTPIGGLVPIFNMLTGEVIFGGVGAGLYGVLMFAVIAVFIAGQMVGRTPEYLGKKIERFEVQMAMLATLVLAACVLFFTAMSANTFYSNTSKEQAQALVESGAKAADLGLATRNQMSASVSLDPKTQKADIDKLPASSRWNLWPATAYGNSTDTYYGSTRNNVNNGGAHGFGEILYAYTSAAGNNGSAFAGLTANTPHYNLTLGISMLVGRFMMIIPLLAMAGSLAKKKFSPASAGTFPTDDATFTLLLVGTIIIVNVLTYFPALSLGPIVEHLQMQQMKTQ